MDKDKLVASAQRYLRKGQYKRAVVEMEKIVVNDPSDMRARLELADLLHRSQEQARAVELYMDSARRYDLDGFGLKALGVYLQVVRLDPDNREARAALGKHYADHGLLADAAAQVSKALASVPQSAGERGRLEVVKPLLEMDPDNLGDRLLLAEAYSGQGLLKEAVREFRAVAAALDERAAEADYQLVAERLLYHDNDPRVAKTLAASYVAQEEPQRALAKLKVAFEATPQDVDVLGLVAESFNQLGQVHKAVAVLKEMARLYDDNGLIHERDECHTKVLMLDPTDRSAREALGDSETEAEGQTLEFYPQLVGPSSGAGREGVAGDDLDDFDFDFDDDDEIGFGGGAENTIVDDAFIPEGVREHFDGDSGLSLTLPGASKDKQGDGASVALQEDIRELDFYINNGLVEEAEALLQELIGRHGQHPLLERRGQQLAELK
ncbi:MAG: hypothetical protein CSA66_04600 [Proteobacteria bacterium]|nr:MAG: hypothetical protein CSA66_04600 [Pseudomonadota bacterium]